MVVEGNMDRAIAMEGERQKSDDDEVFSSQKISQRKEPWLTPNESCASDETEEEEVKPVRPHLACRIQLAKT